MKRLLTGALALILSLAASATTLNPIQLLNPAGSTSGQAIVSTGASTAPAWANVDATTLAAIAANTVVANVTASSASPTAFAMPSCSASNSALQWASGTGFICGTTFAKTGNPLSQFAATTSAQLAGIISDETGSGALVFGTSPTISGGTINSMSIGATTPNTGAFTTLSATGLISPTSTVGIKGTTTNDSAQAGSVGEYISSTVVTGSAVALTTGVAANVTSISLTAGDWDVFGAIDFNVGASTALSVFGGSPSLTSATILSGSYFFSPGFAASVTTVCGGAIPTVRVSIASTTTVFLVAQSNFSGGTMTAFGFIGARRRR